MKNCTTCTRCLMSNKSDPTITFDSKGHCNYCTEAIERLQRDYFPNEAGTRKFDALIEDVKRAGKGKKYDCIIGISGGLDSSYLAYLLSGSGLRVLAVHIDDGYDTEISKKNIRRLVEKTGFDYEVITPDAVQFNALTLAFMKAGVPNIAVPQDNVLFAFLYRKMKEYRIPYFLSGGNLALESIVQKGNTWKNSDVTNIKDIHREFGTEPIDKLEFYPTLRQQVDKYLFKIHTATPLDYIDYNRDRAFRELYDYCGFEYYGRKHLENALTAFIQLRWYPEKFSVDKRTWHLSSMILSGQLTREEAQKELDEPIYDKAMMDAYEALITHNLGITKEELEALIAAEPHQHYEYKSENDSAVFKVYTAIRNIRRKVKYGKV